MAQTLPTNLDSHRFTRASRIVRNLEASQLPASQHDLYLLRFLSLPVTYQMVTYVASYTSAIVDELLRTVPSSRPLSRIKLPDLEDFVLHVCRYSKVSTSTLMVSIIYLFRLRKRMPRQALAIPGTAHRLLLAALIIASKVSNDTCLRNSAWVQASAGLFEIAEVNIMERQFLYLLDFDLVFDEQEAISHFQPVIELLGADLRDLNSYHKVKEECSITQPPPKRPVLSFNPFRSGNSNVQVVRRAVIDDEKERLEVRESALRRVARGSQERMARLPRSSLKQAPPVATPTPILVVPPSSSSRFAPTSRDHPKPIVAPLALRPSRPPTRSAAPSNVSFTQSTRIPSALSQSAAPETSNISRRSAPLGTVLARAPSTDSISSDSIGGLTADEGTSSSSVSLSDEDLDDEQDADDARVIRVVASLQMMAVDGHTRDGGLSSDRIETSEVEAITSSKAKRYGALQQQPRECDIGSGSRRTSRFGWTRRRSASLKPPCSGDEPRQVSQSHCVMDRNYQHRSSVDSVSKLNTTDQRDSSRRHSRSSRSAFSSSASTIMGSSEVQMTTGPAPTNRNASCATITPSRSRVASFGSMGIPITTASASSGSKQYRSDHVASSSTGSAKNAGIGMSISASIRNFLIGRE